MRHPNIYVCIYMYAVYRFTDIETARVDESLIQMFEAANGANQLVTFSPYLVMA